jgi:hypothetical protein
LWSHGALQAIEVTKAILALRFFAIAYEDRVIYEN